MSKREKRKKKEINNIVRLRPVVYKNKNDVNNSIF